MAEQTALTIGRDEARHRYEARLDGAVAGYIDYRDREGTTVLIHTETAPEFQGRGVGSALARAALDEIRARGGTAVVLCPFLRAWLAKHPGAYDDVIADAG